MNHSGDEFWRRFLPWLQVQARKLRLDRRFQARFDHSELVSCTVEKAIEGIKALRGEADETVMCWLLEILHNVFKDRMRYETARKRDVRLEKRLRAAVNESKSHLMSIFDPKQSTPSQRAERAEIELRLACAVQQLPENQRDVFILFHYQNRSLEEISAEITTARETGKSVTVKAVTNLLHRARKAVRDKLRDVDL
jgi:RNA polymerase sigma-70 factor (ECF subfamily)